MLKNNPTQRILFCRTFPLKCMDVLKVSEKLDLWCLCYCEDDAIPHSYANLLCQ